MLLGHWGTVWLAFRFVSRTGQYSRRFRRKEDGLCGFGAVERTREHGRTFFCLYRSGRRIFFQAGERRWPLDTSGVRFEYRLLPDKKSSEFRVLDRDQVVFVCSYRHRLRSAWAKIDATYDNIDFERDHFLGHVGSLTPPLEDRDVWQDAGAVQPGIAADGATPRS
jgi:hypothetical protein